MFKPLASSHGSGFLNASQKYEPNPAKCISHLLVVTEIDGATSRPWWMGSSVWIRSVPFTVGFFDAMSSCSDATGRLTRVQEVAKSCKRRSGSSECRECESRIAALCERRLKKHPRCYGRSRSSRRGAWHERLSGKCLVLFVCCSRRVAVASRSVAI